MDKQLKQRLIGAAVLMSLIVIFVPMLVTAPPKVNDDFKDDIIPQQPQHSLSRNVLPEANEQVPQAAFVSEAVVVAESSRTSAQAEVDTEAETDSEELVLPSPSIQPQVTKPPVHKAAAAKKPLLAKDKSRAKSKPEPDKKTAQAPQAKKQQKPSKSTREGLTAWVIQVGSFSTQEKADKLKQKIHKAGFPVFAEQSWVKNRNVFRVRIGPELDRKRAEKMLADLKKKLKISGIIVRYP
ncbi:MAG: SPOR domain-containing protein [gamma proteobacterium symbiont of Bathyaustriella thionipta]|nr:SPOR domain-containing protein [gamma proteobacterium symbiont of Bathyaustriella thionipta]